MQLVVPGPFEASEWEPITITAVEGLKQCAYFIYQPADEEGLWERDGLGDVLARQGTADLVARQLRHRTCGLGCERAGRPRSPNRPTGAVRFVVQPAYAINRFSTLAFERVLWHSRGARGS